MRVFAVGPFGLNNMFLGFHDQLAMAMRPRDLTGSTYRLPLGWEASNGVGPSLAYDTPIPFLGVDDEALTFHEQSPDGYFQQNAPGETRFPTTWRRIAR